MVKGNLGVEAKLFFGYGGLEAGELMAGVLLLVKQGSRFARTVDFVLLD
ncbi:MAG: hypothetical protein AAGB46_00435 [Verrucomicrobiota bacterium]